MKTLSMEITRLQRREYLCLHFLIILITLLSHMFLTAHFKGMDIAWALVNAIGSDCLQRSKPGNNLDEMTPVGSWTAFMNDTTSMETIKCKLEDLPVVPFPPSDNIVKWYMDMDLELNHVFVHHDEAINSKIRMIMWLHQGRYEKIIPLIGGFHIYLFI